MAKLLDAFERQIAAFDRGGEPDYDILQGVVDYCLSYPDLYHHPKEDLVLAKLEARNAAAAEAVGDLRAEHEALGETTRLMGATVRRVLSEGEVPRETVHEIAAKFLGFYRRHIEMEEGQFFPAAVKALTPEDWRDIEAELNERQDPLFGQQPEERFVALRRNILEWEQEQEIQTQSP